MSATTVSRRELAIDKYVEEHKDTELERKEPFELNGQRKELDVYRLPVELLIYSIRNGRFAAELRELEAQLNRYLNPEDTDDAKLLEELLLHNETQAQYIAEDIRRVGQLRPGVTTRDGSVIDGNRRMAVLKRLYAQTGEARYQYFETVRLPASVSPRDLWKIEAGIQLSADLKVSYGPVNELLKIKEGLDAGYLPREIALILGGGLTEDEVRERVQRLSLIEAYLSYIGKPMVYSAAEKRVEHFIDLQSVMVRQDYRKLKPEDQALYLNTAFEFIRAGVPHLQIRNLRRIVQDADTAKEVITKTKRRVPAPLRPAFQSSQPGQAQGSSDAKLIEQVLAADPGVTTGSGAGVAERAGSAAEDDDDMEPVGTETPADVDLKKAYVEIILDGVDKVEARKREAKPLKTLVKAARQISLLKEFRADKLRPLLPRLEALLSDVETILKRAKE